MFTLKRIASKSNYTIGKLYFDNSYYCDTLEPSESSRIPFGIYNITRTYSPKFGRIMPLVNNVTGRAGIRIHWGNTSKDTSGCILVGDNDKVGMVCNSKMTFERLDQFLICLLKFSNVLISVS